MYFPSKQAASTSPAATLTPRSSPSKVSTPFVLRPPCGNKSSVSCLRTGDSISYPLSSWHIQFRVQSSYGRYRKRGLRILRVEVTTTLPCLLGQGYQDRKKDKLTWKLFSVAEIKTEEDLIPPGAKPGTVPTDYIQATGLERLELIGKMQGIDIFDMRPLDASRKGT
ncbi:Cytochrome c oxidase subunit 4 [Penicillium chermesinum]|uniref:Cytochrome c oxidase subunit 4 n=1 Tax=Penicillium chermesinum TaxID=63820 RepID=A0A9W9NYY3_9EURO|nr:Cytochrome c oxidase subunit 4 [Penicillium chermesinum]KAJ5232235.1 Cytochrome c oxidase subunit 4 [Penicillium chermesinum]